MINEARTLLLNLSPVDSGKNQEEDYIPPDFVPVVLPDWLNDTWLLLFGKDSTRNEKLYRAQQLMILLHSSGHEKYLLLDTRITYKRYRPKSMWHSEPKTLTPLTKIVDGAAKETADKLFDNSPFKYLWNDVRLLSKLTGLLLAFIYYVRNHLYETKEHQVLVVDRD